MTRRMFGLAAIVALVSSPSFAALVLQKSDSAVPAIFANGGGGGFGGTLGNGSISMDVAAGNLNIGFVPGNALNDIVALYLDTKPGAGVGYLDADMRDHADGGRTAISELTLTQNDVFPTHIFPDYGLAIGNFGSVLFELNAGNTDGHLNFLIFNPATTISIPLATLGNPAYVDFFAGYTSGGGYNSNESLPYSAPLQSNGNPGFGDGQFGGLNTGGTYENYNRFFTTPAPEPATFLIWGVLLSTAGLIGKKLRAAAI
jgi:hypothetical protein